MNELALDSEAAGNGALAHGVQHGAGQPETMKIPLVISDAFMCQFTCVWAFVALTHVCGFAGDVSVEKRDYFEYNFKGTITDISLCDTGTNQQILILAQANGVLLDEQKRVVKKLSFDPCSDTAAFHTKDGRCLLYCPGGGFSPVWASDLDGQELWRYTPAGKVTQSQVYNVVPDSQGRFYVCTFFRGVRILDSSGNQIGSLEDNLSDIWFADENTATTIRSGKGRKRYVDVRDGMFKIVRNASIEDQAFSLVGYNWPKTNEICYATYTHLIWLNQGLRETARIALGDACTSVRGAIVQDNQGETYLAVVACYRTRKAQSKLLVIDRRFKTVYEELLPISLAVSTLGRSNHFYVGVGTRSVREYEIKQIK